jgi:hypothetical protein
MGGIAAAYHHILNRPKAMSLNTQPAEEAVPVEASRMLAIRDDNSIPRELAAVAGR